MSLWGKLSNTTEQLLLSKADHLDTMWQDAQRGSRDVFRQVPVVPILTSSGYMQIEWREPEHLMVEQFLPTHRVKS